MSDGTNRLSVSKSRDESAIDDREDRALGFDRGVRGLVEDAPHLTVPLWKPVTVVHARTLLVARAGAHPRRELFRRRKAARKRCASSGQPRHSARRRGDALCPLINCSTTPATRWPTAQPSITARRRRCGRDISTRRPLYAARWSVRQITLSRRPVSKPGLCAAGPRRGIRRAGLCAARRYRASPFHW